MNLKRQPAGPDYGIDAPEGLRNVTLGGLLLVGLGLGLVRGSKRALGRIAFVAGAFSFAIAAAWLASTKIGKVRLWERLQDARRRPAAAGAERRPAVRAVHDLPAARKRTAIERQG